ncbi:DUF948 domain-containing protein [Gardnerella pickettii]|uniref:DUF948 domain-containing protein n=1 Tax=Gardnerella pickettii TaxID=2914924 RepID=UPI0039EE9F2B
MSVGDIAALIAAISFAVLSGFMIYPLIRLGKMFNQISQTVKESGEHALPAIDESVTTVKQVNKTLEDVNAVTDAARTTATNVGALTDLYGAFLGKPVVKIASACYALKDTFNAFFNKATVPTDAAESSARHAANSGESFTSKGE